MDGRLFIIVFMHEIIPQKGDTQLGQEFRYRVDAYFQMSLALSWYSERKTFIIKGHIKKYLRIPAHPGRTGFPLDAA